MLRGHLLPGDAHEGDGGVMRGVLGVGVVLGVLGMRRVLGVRRRGVRVGGRGRGGGRVRLRRVLRGVLAALLHAHAARHARRLLRGRAVVGVRRVGGVLVRRVGGVGLRDVLQLVVRRGVLVGVGVLGVHGEGRLLVAVRRGRRVVVVLGNGVDGHLLGHHPHHLRLVRLSCVRHGEVAVHGSGCQKRSSSHIGNLGYVRSVGHTHLHFTEAIARSGSTELLLIVGNNVSRHAHRGNGWSLALARLLCYYRLWVTGSLRCMRATWCWGAWRAGSEWLGMRIINKFLSIWIKS